MNNCRICKSTEMTMFLSGLPTRLGEVYDLMQCKACGFVYTHPLPAPGTLKKYYDKDYWQHSGDKAAGLVDTLYRWRMRGIIRTIKEIVPGGGRILDWGAGDGSLVKLLEAEGFEGYGIDIYSADSPDRKLINASLQHAPFDNEYFNAITCFHVLEHIDEPLSSVKKAMRLLKPGGILVLEVPNIKSISFTFFKKNWYPLDIPVHVNHFSHSVLKNVFARTVPNRILQVDHFSHRHSPSSMLLSVLPAFSPPRVREKHAGRYPFSLMVLYLFLQVLCYPFTLLESFVRRGEIIRMYVQKAP